jgi:hypothetical protein
VNRCAAAATRGELAAARVQIATDSIKNISALAPNMHAPDQSAARIGSPRTRELIESIL